MNENVLKQFESLVELYREIENINENIKDIKSALKDDGLDSVLIAKIAKAKAQAKVEDLEATSKALLELISEVNS